MRIGVVGAGIGGLAVASGLAARGHDVTVFERADAVRSGGSGITLAPNALTSLDYLGIGAPFRELQRAQPKLLGGQRAPDGRWLSRLAPDVTVKSLAVDRAELSDLLLKQTGQADVRTGAHVATVEPHSGEVVLESGERFAFDLVVGADGIHSAVRRAWPNDPGSAYAGYSVWRGISPGVGDEELAASETLGAGERFGIVPLHDGRVYWFAVASMPDPGRSDPLTADELTQRFANWHDPIRELISSTPASAIQFLPIRELARDLDTFTREHAVLLGDAAHAMTPNFGQGACQALEDAAVLVSQLAKHPDDVQAALSSYDEIRRPRAQMFARQSRVIGKALHVGGRRTAAFRNGLLAAVPDAVIARPVASLGEWRVPE